MQKRIGILLFAALLLALSGSSGSEAQAGSGTYGNNDVTVLAKMIHGEARGEPYVGKVAVGAVILNRVEDKKFPDSVHGVCFQPGAFDAVSDGQYYTLAIPAYTGRKTEKEKFAGAEETYTIEPMMHNGVALQGGTTHYFGDGFAKAFDIKFTARDNTLKYPHQTSWGVSTRMIGAIIMTHGDDNGLILPPRVAPIQVVIVPVAQHKEGVLEKAAEIKAELSKTLRVKLDDSDNSTGWKFAQYEMKGVPLRLEIGPRDIENNSCVLVSRVTREKTFVSLDNLAEEVEKALAKVHDELYNRALENRTNRTYEARTYEEFLDTAKTKEGYIKAMWCGETECEEQLKDVTGGVKSRCIPFVEDHLADTCVCCGKPAKHMVIWGRQY